MNTLRLVLVAIGGYMLYQFANRQGWLGAPAAPGGAPPSAAPAPAAPERPLGPSPLTARQKVERALAAAGVTAANVDVLGFYAAQALGVPAPAPESYGAGGPPGSAERARPFTLDQWWAMLPPSYTQLAGLGACGAGYRWG